MLPRMHHLQLALLVGAIAVSAQTSPAQNAIASSAPSPTPAIADSWHNLSAIAPHTHIHVAADHGGSTCYFIAVDDQNLTCGHHNGSEKGRHVFPRADVKSVKLTRYGVSTLGGASNRHWRRCSHRLRGHSARSARFLDFSGIGRAVCAVVGGLGGTAVGASTDMFRGPVDLSAALETK